MANLVGNIELTLPGVGLLVEGNANITSIQSTGTSIFESIQVTNNLSVGSDLTVTGSTSIGTNLIVNGSITGGTNLNIGDNANIGGNLNVAGSSTFGNMQLTNLTVLNNLTVCGDTIVRDDVFIVDDTTISGSLTVVEDSVFQQKITSQTLEVTSNVSLGTTNIYGSATIRDTTYIKSLDVSESATLSGILRAEDLVVRGDASLTTLDVSDSATIKDLTVTGSATISGTSFTGDIDTSYRIILNPGNRHVWTYKDTYSISFDTTTTPPDRIVELSSYLFEPYTTFRGYFEDTITASGGITHIKIPNISDVSGFHPLGIELYLVNVSDGVIIQTFDGIAGSIKRTGTLSGGTNDAYIEIKTFQKSSTTYEYIARLYDLT